MQDTQIDLWSVPQEEVFWSGRPGSNRRHLPWQGSTLPLSYSRPATTKYSQILHPLQRVCTTAEQALALCPGAALQAESGRYSSAVSAADFAPVVVWVAAAAGTLAQRSACWGSD